jgi:ribosome assembly protein RRB1
MHDSEVEEEEEEKEEDLQVYLPGQELEDEHTLVADHTAYDMLHAMNVEWPCLSFDILQDNLGQRSSFPMTVYMAAGSQADTGKENQIYVMKSSNLHKTRVFDSDDDEESDDDNLDEDPILEYKTIPHEGGVNRIRYIHLTKMHAARTGTYMRHNVR